MADDSNETASVLEWLGLISVSAISFWSQAVITEERFVPSLNVIATFFSIRSDVAGATLMAAGASSPELLASFTTLFVTHTSLGIGTIVGSEIFNQVRNHCSVLSLFRAVCFDFELTARPLNRYCLLFTANDLFRFHPCW